MTATNHVITGAVLAVAIPHPAILPLAFMTHFVLDALPHFGSHPKFGRASKRFFYFLLCDMAVAAAFLITLSLLGLPGWQLMVAGGILCASPDLFWLPGYLRALGGGSFKPARPNHFMHFHSVIQRYQIPSGWMYEIIWLMLMLFLFGWLSSNMISKL